MDVFSLLDEIQTIARNGLHYTAGAHDRERYERLMSLATRTYGELLNVPGGAVRERFLREIGYITPKVGSDGAIFDKDGKYVYELIPPENDLFESVVFYDFGFATVDRTGDFPVYLEYRIKNLPEIFSVQ